MKKTINSPHRVISRVSNCELMSELFRNAHARWRSLGHKDPELHRVARERNKTGSFPQGFRCTGGTSSRKTNTRKTRLLMRQHDNLLLRRESEMSYKNVEGLSRNNGKFEIFLWILLCRINFEKNYFFWKVAFFNREN